MAEFNWQTALLGGGLIGIAATVLLLFNGRIAGISGMVNGAISLSREEIWRWMFIVGILLGAAVYEYGLAAEATPRSAFAPAAMILGGLLVGWGTRMGNGCTSGHGVCGLGRLSARSLVAVITFLITAILTVFIVRHSIWDFRF
ncbi:YeeE/YedE family protein [Merismopedia glauca]|uniref:YeeE/YedE family protein n=1 Tax=Merismopedia glauca CCAP 1448/3 TaxID=1296344 RepID=A0A2T1BXR1_9CYAN|nr:YeeE/YedE thiosulfate transporter family protein [Merismopedia glauca]PSB00697.1 YeeE/YedE family protein [Merismopedia glauca CCAP 1448/3]